MTEIVYYNNHLVRPIGWLQYYVTSASRQNTTHLVDLESDEFERGRCSCEAYDIQGHRPCRHMLACIDYIVDGLLDPENKRPSVRNRLRTMLELYYADEPIKRILPISQDSQKRQYQLKKVA